MKTINWSKFNLTDFEEQTNSSKKDSSQNTIVRLRRKIAKKLNDLGDCALKDTATHKASRRHRLLNFDTYSEPQIWERKDRYGNIYYRIYDPKSDRHFYFNSEDEVRWWLDKRYYL